MLVKQCWHRRDLQHLLQEPDEGCHSHWQLHTWHLKFKGLPFKENCKETHIEHSTIDKHIAAKLTLPQLHSNIEKITDFFVPKQPNCKLVWLWNLFSMTYQQTVPLTLPKNLHKSCRNSYHTLITTLHLNVAM